MTIHEWLKFSRIHTAAATISSILLGYYLGGGQVLSVGTVIFMAFGLLFHWAGFADNNLQDFKFDIADPMKEHFPLGRTIDRKKAEKLVGLLFLVGIMFAAGLSWGDYFPFFIFLTSLGFGLLYNRVNKTSLWAGVFIGLCFSLLPLFSFYLTARYVDELIVWVSIYAFAQVWFQNAISGSLKDLASNEYNPLRALGAKVEDGLLHMPDRAKWFSLSTKFLGFIPLLMASFLVGFGFWTYSGLVLFALAWLLSVDMVGETYFNNMKLKKAMAIIEILTVYAVVLACYPVIGLASFFIIGFSITYFVVMNRLTWGTVITPNV